MILRKTAHLTFLCCLMMSSSTIYTIDVDVTEVVVNSGNSIVDIWHTIIPNIECPPISSIKDFIGLTSVLENNLESCSNQQACIELDAWYHSALTFAFLAIESSFQEMPNNRADEFEQLKSTFEKLMQLHADGRYYMRKPLFDFWLRLYSLAIKKSLSSGDIEELQEGFNNACNKALSLAFGHDTTNQKPTIKKLCLDLQHQANIYAAWQLKHMPPTTEDQITKLILFIGANGGINLYAPPIALGTIFGLCYAYTKNTLNATLMTGTAVTAGALGAIATYGVIKKSTRTK